MQTTTPYFDTNTYCLTRQHIISVTFLPHGHLVRGIIAAASVGGYLRDGNYKFVPETRYDTDRISNLYV